MSRGAILMSLLVGIAFFTVSARAVEPAKTSAAPAKDSEAEPSKFHGTWQLKSLVRDGKQTDPLENADVRLIFSDDQYTYKDKKGDRDQGTFAVDASKPIAVMRTTLAGGPNRGKSTSRIYKWVDVDTVMFCSPGPSEPQPDRFESPAGSGRELSVWVREKS